ncbi:hypothetical protein SteCoe_30268 [Stentor coeruleus]|uniref:Acid phosphatase n=1 Tax=Stentor coeruleus TaxID=5963 RepID=A0A1R2B4B5_9CILI|nr:hypothetical protein SteCoe_30268 [Stentor coeruleus]
MFIFILPFCFFPFLVSSELVGLVQLARHGARSPLKKYPWDNSPWKVEMGELTSEGSMQHYIIGQEFRQRYIIKEKFLNSTLSLQEIYIQSTDFRRTIKSAQSQMLGFYPNGPILSSNSMQSKAIPPFEIPEFSNTMNTLGLNALPYSFQPVVIKVMEKKHDRLLLGHEDGCEIMKEYKKAAKEYDTYKLRVLDYEKRYKDKLEKILNMGIISFEEASYVADALECIKFHNYPLPDGIDENIYDALMEIKDYKNSFFYEVEDALKLAVSEFFIELVKTFNKIIKVHSLDENKETDTETLDVDKVNSFIQSVPKYKLYLAHDTTLISILSALEAWNSFAPPFASTLLFELHKINGDFLVKTIFNDVVLKMQKCYSGLCNYNYFKTMLEKKINPKYELICQVNIVKNKETINGQ